MHPFTILFVSEGVANTLSFAYQNISFSCVEDLSRRKVVVPGCPTCAEMFGNEVILLLLLCSFNPLQCYTLVGEVSEFLEDNGWTNVSVVRNHRKTDILAEAIMKRTSRTLYTRALNAGSLSTLTGALMFSH